MLPSRNLVKYGLRASNSSRNACKRIIIPNQRLLVRDESTTSSTPTNFSAPSRPRPIHPRPTPVKELPKTAVTWILGAAFCGLSGWGVFLLYATNLERLSSSVTRQVISNLKQSEQVQAVLGTPLELPPAFLFGDPWISGSVNMPAGHVDLSFRVQGPRTGGTVYFTSVRKDKGLPFTILRFKIITDDGETIHLVDEKRKPT
ncbi:hypothetical protein M408DRAFT_63327 [Serendipita vermifera MAFF 305830]|uniref:DUF1783-domain-containing protein n=1 Tax=Serendipita vermifera MAFF 305830 TaxID=933852 RepID=A0A0C3B6G2_SERVB|nr:hypothetical protein M408DRAFT_63327 [Serendipita vermifera MAFF 305830]